MWVPGGRALARFLTHVLQGVWQIAFTINSLLYEWVNEQGLRDTAMLNNKAVMQSLKIIDFFSGKNTVIHNKYMRKFLKFRTPPNQGIVKCCHYLVCIMEWGISSFLVFPIYSEVILMNMLFKLYAPDTFHISRVTAFLRKSGRVVRACLHSWNWLLRWCDSPFPKVLRWPSRHIQLLTGFEFTNLVLEDAFPYMAWGKMWDFNLVLNKSMYVSISFYLCVRSQILQRNVRTW